ncbi:hypothetical protein EDB85DRAFT_2140886 [Lactarius pseudohatsudake]|nr:hypothetical protein EDB85DRAFT_2140886 [Lactarius pseudohatsudake]
MPQHHSQDPATAIHCHATPTSRTRPRNHPMARKTPACCPNTTCKTLPTCHAAATQHKALPPPPTHRHAAPTPHTSRNRQLTLWARKTPLPPTLTPPANSLPCCPNTARKTTPPPLHITQATPTRRAAALTQHASPPPPWIQHGVHLLY